MHKSALLFSSLWIIAATTLAASSQDNEALARARELQMQFRQGNHAVVKPLLKTLEDAVARSKDNPRLWEQLGHAYMSQQGSLYSGDGAPDFSALIAAGEHARAAYARSLALDPTSHLTRASHGMSTMVVSQLKGDGPGMAAGIEEMNATVRQAPKAIGLRLTRGFTIVHLPPDMRDNDAVTEDLQFILDAAPGGRQEDMLHVLLGDVYAELGRLDDARREYARVTGASAFAAEQTRARMADLAKGAVTPASITQVRMATGTCVMCHAPGTDN
jgi:hypothetical protein